MIKLVIICICSKFIINIPFIYMSTVFNNSYKVFLYLTIHDTIQYTIQKKIIMKKSIYNRSHVLTIMPLKSKANRQSMFGTIIKSKDNR
jgi:hypothetical protein